MHLLNNPFELPNGICVMEVTDYSNKGAYVVTLNPGKKPVSYTHLLSANAEVKLPAFFSDGMVMQQQTRANLWGTATPNAPAGNKPSPGRRNFAFVHIPSKEMCIRDRFLYLQTFLELFSKKNAFYPLFIHCN